MDDSYSIDQIFDPGSVFFSGALQFDAPASAQNVFIEGISPATLAPGEVQGNTTVTDGYLQSENYAAGLTGWRLTSTSGEFNFNINVQQITLGTSGYIRGGQTAYSTGTGFFLGYSTAAYKLSIGDGGIANYLNWDGTNLIVNGSPLIFTAIFSTGADGNVTISVDTTLSSDMHYNNLTINSGKILTTGGYRIFVAGTLTNNGIISNNGGAGGTGGGHGAGTTSGTTSGSGDGDDPTVGATGGAVSNSFGGSGGSGGRTGGGGTGGEIASTPSATAGGIFHIPQAIDFLSSTSGSIVRFRPGAGGGGGGGAITGNAGQGGGGGGTVLICARFLDNTSGTIRAAGGAGGNGLVNGDGGGGGGGGVVMLVYSRLIAIGTVSVAGGAGGTKAGTGANGVAGSSGNSYQLAV